MYGFYKLHSQTRPELIILSVGGCGSRDVLRRLLQRILF